MNEPNLLLYLPITWSSVPRETFKSILELEKPKNVNVIPFIHTVSPLDFNRNDAIERAIFDFKADYIAMFDADQTFPRDTLIRLLETNSDKNPVTTGVYYRKTFPHYTVVGNYVPMSDKIEMKKTALKSMGFMNGEEQCLFYTPVDPPDRTTPFEVDVSGAGCLLIKTSVFARISQPYFKYFNGYQTGDHSIGRISEEMWFFACLKKEGIRVMCDPRVQCGHLMTKEVTYKDAILPEVMGAKKS